MTVSEKKNLKKEISIEKNRNLTTEKFNKA